MKKEASAKNKKWLWLAIALVALLAVAGVVVAVLFMGGGNQDSGDAVPESKLYWNVDKKAFTENTETGLTTREPADDGLYHVRLATGGEIIEVLVSDGRLINYIDTLDALGLVFDADGMVVDALDPSVFNPEIVRDFFVKRITDTHITVNSSIAMNGMDMTFEISGIGLYDVSDEAEQCGMPGVPGLMDSVCIYGDMDGNPTDLFIVSRADTAEIYYPLGNYWNKNTKQTTRVPDENGVYTIEFAYKGEVVELKCKDKSLVNQFDNINVIDRTQALKFDEEGYIIGDISTQMAIKGMQICDRYTVEELNGKTFHAKSYLGSTSGREVDSTMLDDCEVYLVCDNGTVQSHIGEKTELQLGDRILCYADLEGNAKLIYVLNRRVDSKLYFNIYPKSISQVSFETLRKPNENGYYVFQLAVDGKVKTYRTKDVKLATFLDKQESRGVGLKLRGDIIEAVYEQESVTGNMVAGIGRYVTGQTGMILSMALANNINSPANSVMNADCKIYNVSTDMDGTAIGSETTLRLFDQIICFRNNTGISHIFVTRRYNPDAKLYWNTEAKMNADYTDTSRVPNSEGYYVYTMAHEGKLVTVKTKDRKMAYYLESRTNKLQALKVKKDPNHPGEYIVKYAYNALSVVKAGYFTASSYFYDHYNKDENRLYVYYIDGATGNKAVGNTKIYNRKGLPIYNIANGCDQFKGEKTSLKKDDKVIFIVSQIDWVAEVGYVTERKFDAPLAYNQTRMYNSTTKETTRTSDANGYYVFDLAVNGKVKQYKTKDKAIASKLDSYSSAFTLVEKNGIISGVYVANAAKDVNGLTIGRYDVTTIKGNKATFTRNRPTASDYGTVSERTLAKDVKVYDVSPYAKKWGAEVKLGLGDRVEAYANPDGEVEYIYIIYACTREEGPISKCDHCKKEVWWEPYVGENFNVADIHYYFPGETTISTAFGIGANEKPVIANGTSASISNIIKVYSDDVKFEGKTIGANLSVTPGQEAVVEAANKIDFSKGGDVYADCPACGEKNVRWQPMTKDAVWHKLYNTNYDNTAAVEWHSHFYMSDDIVMTRSDKALITNALGSATLPTSTMCIHLNGHTYKSKGEIRVEKSIINIMGDGVIDVDCTAAANVANGTIYIANSSGHLNLYGGTYKNSSKRMESSYVFDLNGQKVTGVQKTAQVYGTLDIFDTAGGGVLTTKSAKSALGGVIVVGQNGVVNLHSGTLTSNSAEPSANGGVVFIYSGGTFNMLGGKITGASAEKGGNVCVVGTFNMKKGTVSNGIGTVNGGNIYAYMGGTVNMYGGTISGGNADYAGNVYVGDSTFNLKGGTIKDGTAVQGGGNFRIMDNSVVNISGGTITGGTAAFGGNFTTQASNGKLDANGKQAYATINITGGTISNGTSTGSGGSFYAANYSKINHTGGVISGGSANVGTAIAVNASTTTRLVLGATITGGDVYVNKNGTTTLTGAVKLDALKLLDGAKVTLDNLDTAKAKVKVDATGAFTVANEKAADYKSCFESIDPAKNIAVKTDNIMYCDVTPTECPICHETTNWAKISENGNRISATTGKKHWIIDKDTVYSDNIANAVVYNNTDNFTLCIDLNGKTLQSHNGIQANKGTINLFGGGTFINTSESTSSSIGATALYLNTTATVNLYDGVVIKSADPADSAVLFAGTAPSLNLNSGAKLEGDVVVKTGSKPTLNINGGVITGTAKMYQGITVLDGAANVNRIETGVQGMLNVKSTFTGTAVVDFPVYEAIAEEPGYAYAYTFNATVDGAFTGTLMNTEGKQFTVVATDVGGTTVYRLKVETTKTQLNGNEIAAAAETMEFPSGVENNTAVTAFCPACNKVVTWKAIKGNNQRILMNRYTNSHLYMSEDMTKTNVNTSGDYAIFASSHTEGGEHTTACLHFNGKTYTANSEIQIDTGTVSAKGMTLGLMGKGKFITDLSSTNNNFNRSIIRVGSTSDKSSFNVYGVTLETTNKTKPAITYYAATSGASAGVNNCALNLYGNTTIIMPADSTANMIGSTIQYKFNDYRYTLVDGVLTVTGAKATEQPAWLTQKDSITKIVLGEKVTTVAAGAFKDCANVTNVTLTNKVTSIGNDAFAGCTGITKVEFMGSTAEWAAVTVGTGNEALTSKIVCHVHSYTPNVTAPTCTEKGYTTYTCDCGDTYKDNEVAAKGHGTMNADYKCPDCGIVVDVQAYATNKMTFPTDGSNSEQLCPHCNEIVVWKAAPANTMIKNDYHHYYLAGDTTIGNGPAIQANSNHGPNIQTMCFHFNGHTLNAKGGIVAVGRNLNLMGTGGLNSDCSSTGGWNAFAVRMWGTGTIHVYGGHYALAGNYNSLQFREVGANPSYIYVYPGVTFTRGGSAAEFGYSGTNTTANCHLVDYR